jgi:hypothetical protein
MWKIIIGSIIGLYNEIETLQNTEEHKDINSSKQSS